MAKLSYSKLALNKINQIEPKIIEFNGQNIEIIQYLPIEKKLDLISNIINKSIDNNNYYNPCRIDIFMTMEIIFTYTNLTFTEKQKEDICKLYDYFTASGLAKLIITELPDGEYNFIHDSVVKTIKNIYKYKNSAMGILESISSDYSQLNLDATEIQEKIADPDNMALLKGVLTKLG